MFRSLQSKTIALVIASTLVSGVGIGMFTIISFKGELNDSHTERFRAEIQGLVNNLDNSLSVVVSDLKFLVTTPPIQGMIRARDNGGKDPKSDDSEEVWRSRLATIFSGFMKEKKHYRQLSIIWGDGRETVRVERADGKPARRTGKNLKDQAGSEYFKGAFAGAPGVVYSSNLTLNRNGGVIELPYSPVIRYGISIADPNGEKRAVILATVNGNIVTGLARKMPVKDGERFMMVNPRGFYLFHSDRSREFGFDLGNENKIRNDFEQSLASAIMNGSQGIRTSRGELVGFFPAFPNPSNRSHRWMVVKSSPLSVLYAKSNRLVWMSILLVLLGISISAAVAWWVMRILVLPIKLASSHLNESVTQVASTASQLSSSSSSLSDGATEQAANLEETSASLEEMSSMTRLNADNSDQANKLAVQASEDAEGGRAAIHEMVLAMSEINSSSEKIAGIIKVIDGIAFQTNLLALNAAVEAARAGEHGKGFAVVAEEVRNLAQRSAEAAKDTATLIEESVSKSKHGTLLAERSGNSLEKIVIGSKKVVELISDISGATREQAEGVQQVSSTVLTMDQLTQKNASIAEESNYSCEELSALSEDMYEIVKDLVRLVGADKKNRNRKLSTKKTRKRSSAGEENRISPNEHIPANGNSRNHLGGEDSSANDFDSIGIGEIHNGGAGAGVSDTAESASDAKKEDVFDDF